MRTAARWTLGIVGGSLAIVVVAVAAGLVYRGVKQSELRKALAISSPTGINETHYVPIGSVEQWVWIRGQNRTNPVVLIVHGGPGSTTTPIANQFLAFERDYTLVHWDQAGAGKTYARSRAFDPSLTIDRIAQDGVAVAQFLKNHLSVAKVIVLGWSWGSIVGLEMVRARPDLFTAYVGTGQVVNMQKGEALAYANVLAEAVRRNDKKAVKELETIGPPPYNSLREIVVHRAWAAAYEGANGSIADAMATVFLDPNNTLSDAIAYFKGQLANLDHFLGPHMDGPLFDIDLRSERLAYEVPIFVIDGALDSLTPSGLARDYVASISAPQKDFVAIEGAGHVAILSRNDEFLRLFNERVKLLVERK